MLHFPMYAIIGTPWNTPVDVSGFHMFLHIPQQTLVCLYLPSLENHHDQNLEPRTLQAWFHLGWHLSQQSPRWKDLMGPSVHWEYHGNLPNILVCGLTGLCCLSHERILEMYPYPTYLVSAQSVFTFLILRRSPWYPALTPRLGVPMRPHLRQTQ